MTTITIKNGQNLIFKTHFEDLGELQDYLTLLFLDTKQEFSDEFKAQLDKREKELLSGKLTGIQWESFKNEFLDETGK